MIESLTVHRRVVRLARDFVTSVRSASHLEVTLVEARDTAGNSGWGEAAVSWRVTGESPDSVAAVVAGPIAQAVVGRDARDPGTEAALTSAVWGNAAARSAVSCAIADLVAQQEGQTLVAALGGGALAVRTDMTLSVGSDSEVVASALDAATLGFTTLKLKLAADTNAVSVLRAVRDAVGDDVSLRIDANQAWTVTDAIARLSEIEQAGIPLEFVEQPVAAHDIAGLATVRRESAFRVLADESVRTARDVVAVAEAGAADFVNIKLAKTGGLGEAMRAAEAARDAGLGIFVGCMLESAVGVAAAASFAAAVSPDFMHDLDGGLWTGAVTNGGARYRGDVLELSEAYGLGIAGMLPEVAHAA